MGKSLKERFDSKVAKADGCWLWKAYTDKQGYGHFYVEGRMRQAHRVAYELAYGPIPDGQCAMHKCDNPRCVRPDHLELGTRAQNKADMASKGRAPGRRKLDAWDVSVIRGIGDAPRGGLARVFGVSERQIYHIKGGKRWHGKAA